MECTSSYEKDQLRKFTDAIKLGVTDNNYQRCVLSADDLQAKTTQEKDWTIALEFVLKKVFHLESNPNGDHQCGSMSPV